MRTKITLACTECKQRNYNTKKNKKNDPDRLEMNKYCKFCRKHTLHRETKQAKGGLLKKADEKKPGFFKRIASGIKRFFKDTKSELKKIVWPSRKTVLNNTGVVIIVLVISSVGIGIIDFIFNALVGLFH